MEKATVLKGNSRIVKAYEKFKKETMEAERLRISNLVAEEIPLSDDLPARQKEIEEKTEERMKNEYKCLYTYLEGLLLSIQVTD